MAITLSDGITTLALPDDLIWEDQHTWSPVSQTVENSITGAAIIDIGTRIAQRPITLSGDAGHAWMPLSTVSQLKTWAAQAGRQLALNILGESYSVMFRHHEPPAVAVTPVVDYSAPQSQDFFYGVIKLMEA